ncbi:MAG: hypothetical protein ACXADD_15530, partial [Candidatus Thorarchaeota archaeon]
LSRFADILNYQPRGTFPDIIVPPCEIQETVMDFNDDDLIRLGSDNRYFRYKSAFLKSKNKNGPERVKICNIQLRNQSRAISRRSLRMLMHMQMEAGNTDMISVPDPNRRESNVDKLARALSDSRGILDDLGLDRTQLIPQLDLDTPPEALDNRIEYLVDNEYDAIAFRYRPNIPSAYTVAESLSEKDVWIHLTGVRKRRMGNQSIIPQIHLMPFFSFDSISSYKAPAGARRTPRRGGGPLPTVRERPDPDALPIEIVPIRTAAVGIDREVRFDSAALGFLTWEEHLRMIGDSLNCECFLCSGTNVNGFFNSYGFRDGSFSRAKFRTHLLVHELFASHSELASSQEYIREASYKEYLWEKPVIQRYETGVPEIDGQTLLE